MKKTIKSKEKTKIESQDSTEENEFSNIDISVTLSNQVKFDGLVDSEIILNFKGSDINVKLINSIRRAIMDNVPTYAVPLELVNFNVEDPESNSSAAYNNDMLKEMLQHLPIYDVDPEIHYLPEKYWYKVEYADITREIHPKEKLIELTINKKNSDIVSIRLTSHDINLYIDGVLVDNYKKYNPIEIIKLNNNESIKVHMKAVLGIGERHACWSAGKSHYVQISDEEFNLTVEGFNQCSEFVITERACMLLVEKVNLFKDYIVKNKSEFKKTKVVITIDQETVTLGNILVREFQDHPKISGSACVQPDKLKKTILIYVICDNSLENPFVPMLESCDLLINKLKFISKKIHDLYK